MWFWLSIIATFGFALGHVLVKKGYQNLSPGQTKFLDFIFYILILPPYALLKGGIVFEHLEVLILFGLVIGINYYLYLKGLSKGKISLVSTIYCSSPIFVLIIATLFLGETITFFQTAIILLIVFGALILGLPENLQRELKKVSFEKWFLWGLLGALLIGVNDIVAKKGVDLTSAATVMFLFPIIDAPVASVLLYLEKKPFPLKEKKKALPSTMGVMMNNLAAIAFYEALEVGDVSLVSGILGSMSFVTVVLSFFILKEKITWWQGIGILIVGIGVSVLGFIST